METRMRRRYDAFDSGRTGRVDAAALICGLSLLCAGGREEKVGVFFDLYARACMRGMASRMGRRPIRRMQTGMLHVTGRVGATRTATAT